MASEPPINANGTPQPQLTWANIIGTMLFLSTVAGAAWTLFQHQFTTQQRELDVLRIEASRHNDAHQRAIQGIHDILTARRAEFPTQFEFRAYATDQHNRWEAQGLINKLAVESYQTTKAFEAYRSAMDKRIEAIERQMGK